MSLPRLFPRLFRPQQPRFFSGTRPSFNIAVPQPPPPQKQTLSARLKHLSKEYGYSALGVYLALSALDFPFCFLAVRTIGTERIGEYEHVAVEKLRGWWNSLGVLPVWKEREAELKQVGEKGGASIWTELALAYAVHKSLIFIRVPVTAAVTPKVVKTLRGWGWDIGKKGRPHIGKVGGGKD